MLKRIKSLYHSINGNIQPTLPEQGTLVESEYLKTKRAEAIAYLGDKWLGSKAKFIQPKETA